VKTIRSGSRGSTVKLLQERLNTNGFDAGTPDGIFGKNTKEAVIQYQQAHNLDADGIAGARTWASLMAGEEAQSPSDALEEERKDLEEMASVDADFLGRTAVFQAIQWLGAKEIPNGSNAGPEIAGLVGGYNAYWGLADGVNRPWCAMAVSSWVGMALHLGTSSAEMKWADHPFEAFYGGVSQVMKWGEKNGVYTRSSVDSGLRAVKCGEVFIMARGESGSDASTSPKAGHTGLVIADNGDGTVTTIEGNTSNKVKSLKRSKQNLMGFVDWTATLKEKNNA